MPNVFDEGVADARPSGVPLFEITVCISESQKTSRLALLVARYPAPDLHGMNIQIRVRESLFDALAGH